MARRQQPTSMPVIHHDSKYFFWLSKRPCSTCSRVPRKVTSSSNASTVVASPKEDITLTTRAAGLRGVEGMKLRLRKLLIGGTRNGDGLAELVECRLIGRH